MCQIPFGRVVRPTVHTELRQTMNGLVKRAILRWRQMLKWIMEEMKKRF